MRKIPVLCGMLLLVIITPPNLLAAPDQYPGDTSIYGGVVSQIQPNVLIVLDTTGSMADTVIASQTAYDPSTVYSNTYSCGTYSSSSCSTNAVYNTSNRSLLNSDVNNVVTSCGADNPQSMLKTTGQYNGRKLKSSGACNSTGTGSYALGNYYNWLYGSSTVYSPKLTIAKQVIANLLNSTTGVNFGVIRFDTSNGSTFFSKSVSGQTYTSTIKNMDDIFTGTTTNRAALIAAVNSLSTGGATPIGQALFQGMRYFQGGAPAFGSTVGSTSGYYTSPIKASCQKNYLILITDGMANSDYSSLLGSICTNGDCDGDGNEPSGGAYNHSADDVAKYMYDTDLSSAYDGKQNVTTFTIGFGDVGSNATAVDLLNRAADSNHGHGKAYLASDQAGLSASLTQIMASVLEINSSFVAPVVPVSPDNKTASASRMYLGLFKPITGTCWTGNLKKYGLNSKGYLVDMSGAYATYLDQKNNLTNALTPDGRDDRTNASLDSDATDGSFVGGTTSYWSTMPDAGQVEEGGAGQQLLIRSSARNIYTYMGTNTDLTDSSNLFASSNTSITASTLAATDSTTRDNLINYVHGLDAYCQNTNPSSPCSNSKRDWILADILHSKPVVLNYSKYSFNSANEANCSINKSVIFVGANDGMLHAFKDCDGSELWAFIPPEILPNLQYINSSNHTTFVDSTVSMYLYDKPDSTHKVGNGNMVAAEGDKAIILFGQRRGGGSNTSPSSGAYYFLDVTDPSAPQYIKKISSATSGFSELAETWSEPRIAKVKVATGYKIAAFFGAGYDNLNEDSRYGATQTFVGTGSVTTSDIGAGTVTSTGASAPLNPRGRGIYIAEIASLDSAGAPSFTNLGNLIWGYTFAKNATMTSSFPAQLALLDTEAAGYINRIYAVDTAANLWRFDIGARKAGDSTVNTDTGSWTGKKIFASNPGSGGTSDVGRKVFYKPDVTLELGYDMVFFGTGDREHPQNKNVTDRIYAIKVRDTNVNSTVVQTETTGPNGIGLYDVTSDPLQNVTVPNISTDPNNPTLNSEAYVYKKLKDLNGWYIQLNEAGAQGEKVLSSPIVYSKQLYLTTYVPQTLANPDPCKPSNLGYSQTYILGYLTAAAVQGLDASNDTTGITTSAGVTAAKNAITHNGANAAALGSTLSGSGNTTVVSLQRSDRHTQGATSGSAGIASSPVIIPGQGGIINEGDKLKRQEIRRGGLVTPLYWRQK